MADLTGVTGFVSAKPELFLPISGSEEDVQIEMVDVSNVRLTSDGKRTLLDLDPGGRPSALEKTYAPESVSIFANVVEATHGETVEEIIGHGDASRAHQQFTLRQQPLTFTPANTPTGAESSLEIFVNDVKWKEADFLFERGQRERVFVARREDDGTTRLIFGDGKFGALLPTGRENIRARYRKGVGVAGKVKKEQLTLLMNRPLGVKSVTNPEASSTGQDPEQLEEARRNAPLQTLTLGRIVSLQDYEDFSRAFSGVAKAHVTSVWTTRGRGVFVTIALPGGATPSPTDDTAKKLKAALLKFGNPLVPIDVVCGKIERFSLAGQVVVNADRIPEKVKTEIDALLSERFSFDARQFGQNLARSEVVALIQNVPGVQSVTLTELKFAQRASVGDPVHSLLAATIPHTPGSVLPPDVRIILLGQESLSRLEVRRA